MTDKAQHNNDEQNETCAPCSRPSDCYTSGVQQESLFDMSAMWREHWEGMPEYNNINEPEPLITATIKFKTQADFEEFNNLIKKHLYNNEKPFDGMQRKNEKSTWYPLKEKANKHVYESEIPDIHNK